MSGTPSKLFCVADKDTLIIQPLDAMTLVYNNLSGITHIVSQPVPEILDVMASDMVSVDEIVQRLIAAYDIDDKSVMGALVSERLTELEQLGIIIEKRNGGHDGHA